ncbi:hypothetical protein [Sphingomicrobium clamense]|uniref:DUF4229 domain-containing protein n=1 Tax=Sphingomicrobium clamense TaxID=2851013 RepID=A0ABS6V646_9SPHN|nr:hypothetical protein [Sphingomicrobium sp. B8]MBW0145052.1 hypothetical protein [Sphingomicrobium sp. B8]
MATERYEAPHRTVEAADAAVKTIAAVQFARWLKRWAIWLPVLILFSYLDPVLSPLKWVALVLAGLGLLPILFFRFFLGRKTRQAKANIIDAEATIHAYEDEIELKSIPKDPE